jgi:hypothetical protein
VTVPDSAWCGERPAGGWGDPGGQHTDKGIDARLTQELCKHNIAHDQLTKLRGALQAQ